MAFAAPSPDALKLQAIYKTDLKTLSENSKREYTIEDIRNKNLTTYL